MSRPHRAGILALVLLGLLALAPAAMAGAVRFGANTDQISSVGVLDIAEDLHGDLFFGTDNGLSVYDGDWHIFHRSLTDKTGGLLSDHVLAVEFDPDGNLWMGFPNGLQRLEGGSYVNLEDQQLLKALDVHALLRRDREMWIATGNAGLHRYLDGTWTWFQPHGDTGLGCTYVSALAADPVQGTLYVACRDGIWFTDDTEDVAIFSPLAVPRDMPDPFQDIQGDPFGGIYVWNASAVLHFTPPDTWEMVLSSRDLLQGVDITDLRVGTDHTLWIATNNGIYAWRDGAVRDHLDSASGIGNNAVKRIYLDGSRRLWFVTPENVGYVTTGSGTDPAGAPIPIRTFPLPTRTIAPETPGPKMTPGISIASSPDEPGAPPNPLAGFFDGILVFFQNLVGGRKS